MTVTATINREETAGAGEPRSDAILDVRAVTKAFGGNLAVNDCSFGVRRGTITGLIRTFSSIGDANPAEQREKLSRGISEAMYNTAFGLSIALLCMIGHLLLSAAMKKVVSDLEAFSLRFENLLADSGSAAAARAPAAPTEDLE